MKRLLRLIALFVLCLIMMVPVMVMAGCSNTAGNTAAVVTPSSSAPEAGVLTPSDPVDLSVPPSSSDVAEPPVIVVTATCTEPAIDSNGELVGEPLGHTEGIPATYSHGAVCGICGEEYGDPLPLNWMEAGVLYECPTVLQDDISVVVDGVVSVTSRRYASDENNPAREGYEYIEVKLTFTIPEEMSPIGVTIAQYYNYMSHTNMAPDMIVGDFNEMVFHDGIEVQIEAQYDEGEVSVKPDGDLMDVFTETFQVPVGNSDLVLMVTNAINRRDDSGQLLPDSLPLQHYVEGVPNTWFFRP